MAMKITQKFLRAHRESRGFTQEQIANAIGVRNNTVSGWETSNRTMDTDDLEKIAKFYGVHPITLLLAPEQGDLAEAMRQAAEIARTSDPESVQDWLRMGARLAKVPTTD